MSHVGIRAPLLLWVDQALLGCISSRRFSSALTAASCCRLSAASVICEQNEKRISFGKKGKGMDCIACKFRFLGFIEPVILNLLPVRVGPGFTRNRELLNTNYVLAGLSV